MSVAWIKKRMLLEILYLEEWFKKQSSNCRKAEKQIKNHWTKTITTKIGRKEETIRRKAETIRK